MIIQLNDKYRIATDRFNYAIQKKVITKVDNPNTKNPGKIRYDDIAFCGTLEQAVRYLIDYEIKTSATEDLKGLIERLGELESSILSAIKIKQKEVQ